MRYDHAPGVYLPSPLPPLSPLSPAVLRPLPGNNVLPVAIGTTGAVVAVAALAGAYLAFRRRQNTAKGSAYKM